MSKSDNYQYRIVEISLDPAKMNNFANESGIPQHIAENLYPEELMELRQQLLDEIYGIIDDGSLTEHQQRVLVLHLAGCTQNEIAEYLNISQSACCKAINGNHDYKNMKKYGGIIKKIQKISQGHMKIQDILRHIEDYKTKIKNEINND